MLKKYKKINIIDKKSVQIDKSVVIGKNVTIYPGNILKGNTIIGDDVTLYYSNYISNSKIESGARVEYSHLDNCKVGELAMVGPYARLRPNADVGKICKIGNFVEVKNSKIGDGTKVSHLAYVGDADIGKNCNIGCGAIFVNYNGKAKQRSVIEDDVFIGSNANIIAPVHISKGSYICAGSTVTVSTDKNDFVIARTRETIKKGYAKKYHKEEK